MQCDIIKIGNLVKNKVFIDELLLVSVAYSTGCWTFDMLKMRELLKYLMQFNFFP